MDSPHDVPNHLDLLTAALENPGTDLQTVLSVLVDDLTSAIPSLLGLQLTVVVGDGAVTISTGAIDASAVAASLHVPLDQVTTAGAGSNVIFYAGRPGAFVDLAADFRFAYGLDGRVVLDEHFHPPASPVDPSGVTGLTEFSLINQAIGVLIEQGQTRETAPAELHRRAERASRTLSEAAQQLLDEQRRNR